MKSQLSKIADDNQKHAITLDEISEKIGNSTVNLLECKKKLALFFNYFLNSDSEADNQQDIFQLKP